MKAVKDYFTKAQLFDQALTHRSYCNEHPGLVSNERLEFLGDAVLSLVISHRLYQLFPDRAEGELTARRSVVVQTATLAAKAQALGLDQLLRLSRGEEDGGGRSNPSLLANTFEAVLGALYLDQGLETCFEYLSQVFPDAELETSADFKDPKSLLQEKSQAAGWGTPTYNTVHAIGPDHAKKFTISVHVNNQEAGRGQGSSKQRAEAAAATAALANLWPN